MLQLIRTLALNPYIGIHITALALTFILFTRVLGGNLLLPSYENENSRSRGKQIIINVFQSIIKAIYGLLGILLCDISLLWLFGAWTYADWRFHLPSVLLSFILGIQILIYLFFRKSNWVKIGFIILSILIFIGILHVLVPHFPIMAQALGDSFTFFLPGFLIGYLGIEYLEYRNITHFSKSPLKWDITPKLEAVFNLKTLFIFWILSVLQSMLVFMGYSFFSFR
jgi:hypothetical protein